ncbi:hypothetical protein DMN91_009733, partial [Ooceraea biroi]
EIYSKFIIHDRVLIGNKETIAEWHLGNSILNTFISNPNFVGLVNAETQEEVRYQEMRQKSVKCALWLRMQNVQPGDIITVCPSTTIDLYVPFLAGLYIGAVVNTWDINCKLNLDVLRRTRPKVIFTDKKHVLEMYGLAALLFRENFSTIIIAFQPQQHFINLDIILNDFSNYNVEQFVCWKPRYNDIMVILHTINMMTVEKNIEISYMAFQTSFILEIPPLRAAGICGLWYANLGCYYNIVLLVKAIILHAPLVVWWRKDYRQLCAMIEQFQVQWMYFNNVQAIEFNRFITNPDSSRDKDEGIDSDIVSGEEEDVEMLNISENFAFSLSSLKYVLHDLNLEYPWIHEELVYNLPERTNIILLYSYPESGVIASRWCLEKRSNAGYVCKNVELKVINHFGREARPNEHGEICCRSPYMMNGYHLQPMITQSAIDKEGWLHTKDMGCYHRDGFIYVLGNIDLPVTFRGESCDDRCFQNCLEEQEGISQAYVLPVLHEIDGEQPFAFLVKKRNYPRKGEPVINEEVHMEVLEDLFKLDDSSRFGTMFLLEMPRNYYNTLDKKRLYHILVKYLQNDSLCYR